MTKMNIFFLGLYATFYLLGCSSQPQQPYAMTADSTATRQMAAATNQDPECRNIWVTIKNRKDSQIRSNPAHFWCWINRNLPQELNQLVNPPYIGQVTADPHYFNFADLHRDSQTPLSGLGLVDVDDSGQGPFIYDFIRYAVFVRAYNKDSDKDHLKDLIANYKQGLEANQNDIIKTPKVLQKAIDHTRQELEQEHAHWVKKNPWDQKFFEKFDLKSTQKLEPQDKTSLNQLKQTILNEQKIQISKEAYTVHESGSSKGQIRFWFLATKPQHENFIFECKALAEPATAQVLTQDTPATRINQVLKYYSDFQANSYDDLDSFVATLNPQNAFWCRYRHFQFLDREDIKKLDEKDLKKLSEYFAYWLGYKVSYQLKNNKKKFLQDLNDVSHLTTILDNLISKYNQTFKQLNKDGLSIEEAHASATGDED